MSSVIRFIKKRLQPIKRQLSCKSISTLDSSVSRSVSVDKSKSINKNVKQRYGLSNRSKAIRKKSKSNVKSTTKNANAEIKVS